MLRSFNNFLIILLLKFLTSFGPRLNWEQILTKKKYIYIFESSKEIFDLILILIYYLD